MPSIKYKETRLAEEHRYLFKIAQEHYDEVKPEVLPSTIRLNTDQIIALEEAGCFFSIKAEQDGNTVGLIAGYVYNHLQHDGSIFATTNLIQADRSLGRARARIVKGLISAFEKTAKEKYNADFVQVGLSAGNDIRKFIERLGYTHTDYIMTRRI